MISEKEAVFWQLNTAQIVFALLWIPFFIFSLVYDTVGLLVLASWFFVLCSTGCMVVKYAFYGPRTWVDND